LERKALRLWCPPWGEASRAFIDTDSRATEHRLSRLALNDGPSRMASGVGGRRERHCKLKIRYLLVVLNPTPKFRPGPKWPVPSVMNGQELHPDGASVQDLRLIARGGMLFPPPLTRWPHNNPPSKCYPRFAGSAVTLGESRT
jgi:hypothetical protein